VRVTFWGTRGSIATPGPETVTYGGDTSCVAVTGSEADHLLVLDAGTGIRRLGASVEERVRRIDVLLSHLHLDHIIGLGFFAPLFRPDVSITIWGPAAMSPLFDRLGRYLSPPLFPVRLRDVALGLELREVPDGPFERGEYRITADPIIHPDVAVGYRIEAGDRTLAYLPDHEPALGPSFPHRPAWTSGAAVARDADLLVHDAQYTAAEYAERVGWGHSTVAHAVAFADLVAARTLALFHHDPWRDDAAVEAMTREGQRLSRRAAVVAARQGASIELGGSP
jgi:phosphoribosyl 1,2-cyclic phosphodiesterase